MNRLTGRASLALPGYGRLKSKPDASLDVGGDVKELVSDSVGIAGYMVTETQPCRIQAEVLHDGTIKPTEMQAFEGDVDYETDTGQLLRCKNCIVEGTVEMSAGVMSVTFAGERVVEA